MDLAAERLVRAAERLAGGFGAGGRLFVVGAGRGAIDARHVVVEFLHPVTVGRRALPAIQLPTDPDRCEVTGAGRPGAPAGGSAPGASRSGDVTLGIGYGGARVSRPADVVVADHDPSAGDDAIVIRLPSPPADAKVAAVRSYHVMWELTHLFLDASGTPGRTAGSDPAAAALYPMLFRTPGDGAADSRRAEAVRSARAKLRESAAVVEAALAVNADGLRRAAHLLRRAGAIHTFGNGGSSTDAADAAHVLGPRARSLTDDVATITALANDVSFDVVFARQLATLGRSGDVAVGFSTSGSSRNVLEAAAAAKRVGMATIGLAGYDGGAMAESSAFDVVLVVPSESVHRIQEAQSALVARLAAP